MTTLNILFKKKQTPDEPFFLFGETRRVSEMAPLWARFLVLLIWSASKSA